MITYKGYMGRIEYDDDANVFHGEVINTRDVITFQGQSVEELKASLKDSVEDYLDYCRERSEEPDRPFSGKFVVRVTPEIHREAYLKARKAGKSLNAWVTEAIKKTVEGSQ